MQQPPNNSEVIETEDASLGDLLYKFLPFWPLFVLLLIVSLSVAWAYLRYKMPVFRTTATLLIKDDRGNSNTDLLDALDVFGSKKNVENEIKVLQSKTLMQEVVKNLHLYAPVTVEGRLVQQSAYLTSPVVVEAEYPDSIKNFSRINFKYNEADRLVSINKENYPLNQRIETPFGVLKFLPNKYYQPTETTDKENQFYFSLSSVKRTANDIAGQVNVSQSEKQSTVIELSITGEVPKRAEDILNELLKVYNQAAIQDKNALAANTLKFVQDRLRYVVNELDSVEGSLQRFKAKNRITDISAQGQIFLQTVAANDQKLSDINMQLAVLDQIEQYVRSKEGLGGMVPATLGVANPVLLDLLQKLAELELQYTQTKKVVPENNPAVVALRDGIDKLKPSVLENIQSQRKNLIAAKNDLNVTNNGYNSLLKTIPEKERELLSISRQQTIKNNIYTFLLQKREETALSFASAVADSRVIDRAESSDSPVSPKKKLIYVGAILSALFLGIAIIYIKEMLTITVQERSDIEKYTRIPFLGEIAYDRSKSPIVITEGKRSFIAEQFRQLRTSLGFMGINENNKRILVTSSISNEGKSFIAVNLGISLSLINKKVVLIELDLRKPKLSDRFNVSRNAGISNYLIGTLAADELTKSTGIDNLFIIPSGPLPPNPSELISNGRLKELMNYLDTKFDYILIDTAPVNPVTDALIISPLCDVTLFIARHDFTPKSFFKKIDKDKLGSLKNPAVVYNGVMGKGFKKYGYNYGYGYGYGYTDDEKEGGSWWRRIF